RHERLLRRRMVLRTEAAQEMKRAQLRDRREILEPQALAEMRVHVFDHAVETGASFGARTARAERIGVQYCDEFRQRAVESERFLRLPKRLQQRRNAAGERRIAV